MQEFTQIDPALLQRLTAYGITEGAARKLIRAHPKTFLSSNMDRFDHLIRSGVLVIKKTKAAALMHLLTNPDEYPYPASTGVAAPTLPRAIRMEPLLEAPSLTSEYADLTPEQAAEKVVRRLNLFYRQLVTSVMLDAIRQDILDGRLEAIVLMEDAMRAVSEQRKEDFVRELRYRIQGSN